MLQRGRTTQPTIEKLYELRLGSMAAAFLEQQKDTKLGSLSFDEHLSMLVDAEHIARDNRRAKALLKEAELRIASCREPGAGSSTKCCSLIQGPPMHAIALPSGLFGKLVA